MIKAKQISVSSGKILQGDSSNTASETPYTIPTTNGNNGQVLTSNGTGAADWTSLSQITDADGDTKIQLQESTDEDKIRFDTAGSERMIITDQGKVGIGTETPSRLLDVNGSLLLRSGNISRTAGGTEAISIDTSNNTTVGNTLTVDGDGSTGGITITDGNISMRTGTGSVAAIDLYCEVNNAHKISLKAPPHTDFSGNVDFVLPPTEGSNGQFLKSDGSGNTSWSTVIGTDLVILSGTQNHTLTYSTTHGEVIYLMQPTASRTITLPHIGASSIPEGFKIGFKNLSSSNQMTIKANTSPSSNNIDLSLSSHVLSTQYSSITFVSNGSSTWYRIASF